MDKLEVIILDTGSEVREVPCSYHIGLSEIEDSGDIQLTEKSSLVSLNDEADDKKILCSGKRLIQARKYLLEIKDE